MKEQLYSEFPPNVSLPDLWGSAQPLCGGNSFQTSLNKLHWICASAHWSLFPPWTAVKSCWAHNPVAPVADTSDKRYVLIWCCVTPSAGMLSIGCGAKLHNRLRKGSLLLTWQLATSQYPCSCWLVTPVAWWCDFRWPFSDPIIRNTCAVVGAFNRHLNTLHLSKSGIVMATKKWNNQIFEHLEIIFEYDLCVPLVFVHNKNIWCRSGVADCHNFLSFLHWYKFTSQRVCWASLCHSVSIFWSISESALFFWLFLNVYNTVKVLSVCFRCVRCHNFHQPGRERFPSYFALMRKCSRL